MDEQIPLLHVAGYAVEQTREDAKIGLRFVLRDEKGREQAKSPPFVEWQDEPSSYAERERVRLLADSISRYYNTGFTYDQDADKLISSVLRGVRSLPRVGPSEEWKLWRTGLGEHIYEHATENQYLRVVEDEFTEVLSRAQLIELVTGLRADILEPEEVSSVIDTNGILTS